MGEVYRATDTNLKRSVAIKVLPASVAGDAARLARFQREAELLAALNHPNIAAIYGFEKTPDVTALVMELVEGEDLSQRIARGAVPLDEALPIANQITLALEAAHEQGIIHRDLKPSNIKVRSDGTVKVLDFGLAKAVEPAAGTSSSGSNSPTITTPAMTQAGMILGTAAYMSPEQVRGKTVDKRADIWAFGCVLYEILTGKHLFAGDSVPETLALILTRQPDLAALPAATPARIRTLIERCVVKDPRQRLRDIGDARLDLEDAGDTPAASRPVTHLDLGFPQDAEPGPSTGLGPAIDSDGRTVAMIGVIDGVRRAFVRRLDRADAIELPGVGANGIVFSPDGRSVAFVSASGLITRMALTDLQRKDLTSGADVTGGIAWSRAGIVFGRGGALWVVSSTGGAPRALTVLDAARHEVLHTRPVVLPGDRLVLFASQTTDPGAERIESVSIDGGARSVMVERATTPVWSPTGHLLFSRDGAVLAVAFDARSGTPRGPAVRVLRSGVIEGLASGQLALTLSSTGTLVFAPVGFRDTRVVSVSRDGAALAFDVLPSNQYANPRISPDGQRLLVEIGGRVIEALDLARGTRARLTAATLGSVLFSTWNVDGTRVVFRRFGVPCWAAADGSGDSGPVPNTTVNDYPSSPGPDPDSVITLRLSPETSGDVFLMSMSGAFEPKPLINTPAYEGGAQLSPDGRWLLYQSDASGRAEIYVRRYPALDRQWQVSDGGGVQPRWSRNSREIYYRGGGHLVAATLDASRGDPVFGKPTTLFADDYDFGAGASIANYDVTPDGRFIMIRRGTNGGKLRVIINWTEELKQILAAGGIR